MQIDLKTVSIEPVRKTFDHLARRFGDKPASRYQEGSYDIQAAENLHYRPTWDPDQELYDPSLSRIKMCDWYDLKDPRQYYYSTYTLARARQQENTEANFDFVENRGLLDSLPADVRETALKLLIPLRHAAWGANQNNTLICGYGYGVVFTQPCIYHAMDNLGISQYLSRIGLLLGGVEALDQGKHQWLNESHWQPLRQLVEDTMVVRDPFEVFVAQNVVLDGLLYPLVYSTIVDSYLSSLGGQAVSMLTQFMTRWFEESQKWINSVMKVTAAESEDNQQVLQEWIHHWSERATGALRPVVASVMVDHADDMVATELMDAYWKYQGENERKFYAIIDAFAQNNGHLNLTDARYLSALKIFLQAISPGEYAAHKGFTRAGREFPGVGPQVACQMQAIDEIRHAQTQIHATSNYNKFYNGFHAFADQRDRIWYTSVARSFFDDAMSAGPFEFMIAIGFSFEYVLTNLLFVPFMSGAAYNGDMSTVTFGFSAQSDEARHMTLGLECIKFMLEQDPDNVAILQRWIDKWFWRGFRVLGLVSTMMDYMLPKRVMSWREAWEIYGVENGGALFNDLARYGIRPPEGWDDACDAIDHMSHQMMLALYQWNFGTAFHTWIPSESDMEWLSKKYPDTFDKYYRPRWNHLRKLSDAGQKFNNVGLAKLCQTCQMPIVFTEPGDPTTLCNRETEYKGENYHFCSDHCQDIFDHEPEKYIQAWLPMPGLFQAPLRGDVGSWMEWASLQNGVDNGDFDGSHDQRSFQKWREMSTTN